VASRRSPSTDAAARSPAPAGEDFGTAMERLEAIVGRLEGDETLGLEEALALYEQGVALAAECRRRLTGAQLRLTEVPVDVATPPEPFGASVDDEGAEADEDAEEGDEGGAGDGPPAR